jgi:antirestriction protein ArdC
MPVFSRWALMFGMAARAYYTTTDDHIQMPPFQAFTESVVLFNAGA